MSKNIIYIDRVRGDEAWSFWFLGKGWYFLDECGNPHWGGESKERAMKSSDQYVRELQNDT
jgi:hypothetical protein